jgi:16S rRNA C967 or C1407 C5-methylase (RsmB/RsmF family)
MQSFSSALPPFLLMRGVAQKWGERRFDVIDACSAPGNKTVQLAELTPKGRVFAYEKDRRRFELLKKTVAKYNASNILPKNSDFLQLTKVGKFRRVKFILLDPSCSGSGMTTNFTRDDSKTEDTSRTKKSTSGCTGCCLSLRSRSRGSVRYRTSVSSEWR